MWECIHCSEAVEDTFEACWSCGTSRDGTPDPDFVAEVTAPDPQTPVAASEVEAQICEHFRCAKCDQTDAVVKHVTMIKTSISLFDLLPDRYLVVSCTDCGFSELYDARILGTRKGLASLLSRLFGG